MVLNMYDVEYVLRKFHFHFHFKINGITVYFKKKKDKTIKSVENL